MNKTKIFGVILICILTLVSFRCVTADYAVTFYEVEVILSSVDKDIKKIFLKDEANYDARGLFFMTLTDENGYQNVHEEGGMGPQRDFRDRDKNPCKDKYNKILEGGNISLDAEKKDGSHVKYTIPYTNENCFEVVKKGDLFRTIRITLDFKNSSLVR